jgi:hypothetical protein
MEKERKKIQTRNKIKCFKCGEFKTFPNFRFIGKGKGKKGVAGTYRKDVCLTCEKLK